MIALTDTKPAIDFAALTGLTTFLVVFYNGNCFGRYNSMYAECIAIQGKLHNMVRWGVTGAAMMHACLPSVVHALLSLAILHSPCTCVHTTRAPGPGGTSSDTP